MWHFKNNSILKLNIILLSLFTVIFCSISANIKAKELKLRVVTEFLPPYQIVDRNQNLTGYSVEIVKHILAELEIEAEIEVYPWARSYQIAKSRENTLIFSMDRTPEREMLFHWIGELGQEIYSFYKLKSRSDIKAEHIDDLKQYMIGVSRQSSTDQIATKRKFPNLTRVHEPSQLVKMLHAEKIDLAFGIDFNTTNVYYENNIDINLITKVPGALISSTDLYLALSRKTDPKIVERFKQAYSDMKKTGKIEEIRKRWLM